MTEPVQGLQVATSIKSPATVSRAGAVQELTAVRPRPGGRRSALTCAGANPDGPWRGSAVSAVLIPTGRRPIRLGLLRSARPGQRSRSHPVGQRAASPAVGSIPRGHRRRRQAAGASGEGRKLVHTARCARRARVDPAPGCDHRGPTETTIKPCTCASAESAGQPTGPNPPALGAGGREFKSPHPDSGEETRATPGHRQVCCDRGLLLSTRTLGVGTALVDYQPLPR